MRKIKEGDSIECISKEITGLTYGNIYTVLEVNYNNYLPKKIISVTIENDLNKNIEYWFLDHNFKKVEQKTDFIVDKVIQKFKERSQVGIEKYGTTLAENNKLTTLEWIENAKEEAMDFILYLEKLSQELNK